MPEKQPESPANEPEKKEATPEPTGTGMPPEPAPEPTTGQSEPQPAATPEPAEEPEPAKDSTPKEPESPEPKAKEPEMPPAGKAPEEAKPPVMEPVIDLTPKQGKPSGRTLSNGQTVNVDTARYKGPATVHGNYAGEEAEGDALVAVTRQGGSQLDTVAIPAKCISA